MRRATMRAHHEPGFREFVTAATPGLRRLAYVTCGDWHRADDLVQGTFERMYGAWPRASRADDPHAYARRVLVRLFISENRRLWRRSEVSTAEPADVSAAQAAPTGRARSAEDEVTDRVSLVRALAGLPPRQRMVVALRYLEDRPVDEVAALMSTSSGTVKSQCHAALASLRAHLTPDDRTTKEYAR